MKEIEIKISNNEINYDQAIEFMESRVEDINNNQSKELLWFLSHNHVFTQGTSARDDEILDSKVINVIKTNRGGKITYHGPGQIVVYPIIDLENFFTDIHKYLRLLEEAVILTLEELAIDSHQNQLLFQHKT